MPLYEYLCKKCQKVFEILQLSSKDEKEVKCPHCGSKEVEKLLSTFGSRIAGSTGGSCGPSFT